MIEVSHVSRLFGTFRAVDDVSFSIKTGEIVGLLGPNGAGKTTTMRMLTGYIEQTSGSITIDGQDIRAYPKETKRKIGYMPESAPLYSDMIVADYLAYVASMHGVDSDEKISHLVKECGLEEVMHKNIAELSRGYRQRVGLAHALMNDPEILVLDEPTGGLDPNQIQEVRALIKKIGETRTVIISTHILSEVEMLCGRVIIISKGKIAADSPTAELRTRFGESASVCIQAGGCTSGQLAAAVSSGVAGVSAVKELAVTDSACSVPFIEARRGMVEVSVTGTADIRPQLAQKVLHENWNLYELSIRRNSLEDIFRTLTTGGEDHEKE